MNRWLRLLQSLCSRNPDFAHSVLMIIRNRSLIPGTYTTACFTDLGEEAAGEITRLWAQMRAQADNPPGEDYLARVVRLNALRKQAEEVVLAGLILLPPGHDAPESGLRII